MCGLIIGILLSTIFWCSYHKIKSRNPQTQSNREPKKTEDNSTYQELDLSKMNTEDNYQSLRGNIASFNDASNDDNSAAYTELNKIRDVDSTYQSLT